MTLCKNLKLTITQDAAGTLIHVRLRNDLSLEEVEVTYEINPDPKERRYHLREAIVIAMRRVAGAAIVKGLISDCRGGLTTLKNGTVVDPPITFSTDGDAL